MEYKARNVIRFEKGPRGSTTIVVDSYEFNSRRKVSEVPITFSKEQIQALVIDLCQVAGLPKPW